MPLPDVPVGWTDMEAYVEIVPSTNPGTPADTTFARTSYRTTWTAKGITITDGSSDQCAQQAFSLSQSQTQVNSEGNPA